MRFQNLIKKYPRAARRPVTISGAHSNPHSVVHSVVHSISPILTLMISVIIGSMLFSACSSTPSPDNFVQVDGTQFLLKGEPYRFTGTNFWYGAYLGSPGPEGDLDRLREELDLLKSIGITNLRVLAASEKASHSRALQPSFQEAPGVVHEDLLQGLDVLIAEMGKRDMKAVVFLNNMWEWSGGMSVYAEWFGEGKTFDPNENGDWHGFQNLSARFYYSQEAQDAWRDYIRTVITRTNTVTGIPLNEDPAIMSWQLANEPRPGSGDEGLANAERFVQWIDESAEFIQSLAPFQLVSTGNEGLAGSAQSEEIYLDAHDSPHVDYLTFHMWAKNWGWFNCANMEATFDETLSNAKDYVQQHLMFAQTLEKPTVLSEFGLDRDQCQFAPGTAVTYRDQYLEFVFGLMEEDMERGGAAAGTNFWSWGGLGVPQQEDDRWRPGDPFVGDPPQEPQGLNSVFASDSTTIEVIRAHAKRIVSLSKMGAENMGQGQTKSEANAQSEVSAHSEASAHSEPSFSEPGNAHIAVSYTHLTLPTTPYV